ncbi:MAG: hypothetical protein GY941_22360 [Planctomycetes bacterium]|nr:hypothetical protein [Planctomycetota bacterium]
MVTTELIRAWKAIGITTKVDHLLNMMRKEELSLPEAWRVLGYPKQLLGTLQDELEYADEKEKMK